VRPRLSSDGRRWAWSTKDRNREVAAITAVAMANPLVRALVVLPAWSSLATTRLASSPPAPWAAPDISKIPLALSTMGPKVSMARMYPVMVSSPSPARATPYPASARSPWKMV